MRRSTSLAALAIALLSTSAFASSSNNIEQTVIAPDCLVSGKDFQHSVLAKHNGFQLINAKSAELEKIAESHQHGCGRFLDVSLALASQNPKNLNAFIEQEISPPTPSTQITSADYQISYQKTVHQLIDQISPDRYWHNLELLSDTNTFPDRSASTDNGVKAAHQIKDWVMAMAKEAGRDDVEAHFVDTGGFKQPSLVVKVGGQDTAGVVLGAHMDTLTSSWWGGDKPGADDDGTGTVSVLEVAHNVINSGLTFNKPIYFMWYAAEERGLVGSQYVVKEFKEKNIPVDAVMHIDMTGYKNAGDDSRIWLISDNVNRKLTDYLKALATTYAGVTDVQETSCGYGCSDHASWTKGGYVAAMPSESKFSMMNPDIHSSNDSMYKTDGSPKLDKNHMLKYVKLATSFVVEMAQPA